MHRQHRSKGIAAIGVTLAVLLFGATPPVADAAPKKDPAKAAQRQAQKAQKAEKKEAKKGGSADRASLATAKPTPPPQDKANPQASSAIPAPAPAAAEAPAAKSSGGSDQLFSADLENGPTNITAKSLTVKNDKRVFVYTGDVVVTQGNMTMTTDELEGTYDEQNEIDKLYARGNVVIIKAGETPDQNVRATSERAMFDNKTQIATLTKSPQIEQNGSILTADVIKMYVEEDRSVAEGQVRVTLVQKEKAGGKDSKGNLLGKK